MKVMIISSVHSWNDIRIFQKEATTLATAHDVQLYALGDFSERTENNVRIFGMTNYARSKRYKNWIFLLKRALRERPDVLHFHDPELIPMGLLVRLLSRTKVIYDVHEDAPMAILSKFWIPQGWRKVISWTFNLIEKTGARFLSGVITSTDYVAGKFKPKNKRTIAIQNFSNLQVWEDFSSKDKENSAIFLGGLTAIRGISELVDAADLVVKEIPDFKLYLIGAFDQQSFEEKIMAKIKGKEHIQYKGWLTHAEALPYMRKSKVGILCYLPEPNHLTAIANKIFEYMSQGLVVLASNYAHLRKIIVEDGDCGLVCNPENPDDIAEKMVQILQDDAMVEWKGRTAIAELKQKYTWNMEAKRLLEYYRQFEEARR